jgi:hypothetical protein
MNVKIVSHCKRHALLELKAGLGCCTGLFAGICIRSLYTSAMKLAITSVGMRSFTAD